MDEIRIMVGFEGSEQSEDALALGAELAVATGGSLVLAAAFPEVRPFASFEAYELALGRHSDRVLGAARSRLARGWSEVTVEERALGGAAASELLRQLAVSERVDLIVLGSARYGRLGRTLLGSVSERLIRSSPCPVAFAPRGYAEWESRPLDVIGAAYDGSDGAERAVLQAAALAGRASTALTVIGVVEPIRVGEATYAAVLVEHGEARFSRELLESKVDELIESLPIGAGARRLILSGDPARTLVKEGGRAVDLLVVGSHADTRLVRLIVGSVSAPVIRTAPFPVIAVPDGAALGFGAAERGEVREPTGR